MAVRRWLLTVLVPLAVTAIGCSLPADPPAEPTDASSAPPAPAEPSGPGPILGAPGGGAPAPSPTPTTTPTETPQPTATPYASCSSPQASPANASCTDEPGHLLPAVEAAIARVTQTRATLFDFKDTACATCYKVRDVRAYYAAVQAELRARGICTLADGEELGAKDSNASSEQFDILLASGHIRRGPGVYRGICRPAIF